MDGWLDPLCGELDAARAPVTFFFRDDDAGWDDDALLGLLDLFAASAVPLDVAAIPAAVTPDLAAELRARGSAVHQHGYAHTNHEQAGRACEFGPTRPAADQRRDIERGARMLEELLGDLLVPVFTPPWNRCTRPTGLILRELGLALSRDSTAERLDVPGLHEICVAVDWTKARKGEHLAAAARSDAPVGVMLHHAAMTRSERDTLEELLATLASEPNARCSTMAALILSPVGEPG